MGRLTGSLMHRLDLGDWITPSVNDYTKAAARLAGDIAALAKLRKTLRASAKDTIFDAKAHVLELEAAFTEAWKKYGREKKRV
jgi:predicted O-linked N-acetylglucosamine transferase (SPINDLY family)